MGFFKTVKKAYTSRKTEAKQGKYAKERIRKKAKAEYWKAKEKEEIKLAQQMAKHERVQTYKKKTAPRQSFFSMGTSKPQNVITQSTGKKSKQKVIKTTQKKESVPSLVSAPKERSIVDKPIIHPVVDKPSYEKLTKERRF